MCRADPNKVERQNRNSSITTYCKVKVTYVMQVVVQIPTSNNYVQKSETERSFVYLQK